MFRKLVSNLPFSPALVGQIGFYARRLRKEEATRRLGLFMTVLALIVQSFTVFIPSTSANSASTSDFIYGGVSSVSGILAAYDNPNKDFKKIMDYAGITRSELASLKSSSINSKQYGTGANAWLTWGRTSRFSAAQGQVTHDITGTVVYSKPLWLYDTTSYTIPHGSTYTAFVGTSAKMGTFAIMKDCGNLITTKLPTPPPVVTYITVCRPGSGVIQIPSTDRRPSDEDANGASCQPAATCSNLTVDKIDRTHVNITAYGSVDRGATISGYTITVRKNNQAGEVVSTKTIDSTDTSVKTGSMEIKTTGTYYVSVIVKTSLGDRGVDSNANCAQTFTIAPASVCPTNPDLTIESSECQPCPGNTSLWYKSPDCTEKITQQKSAINLTKNNSDATTVVADSSNLIKYTLTVENVGKTTATASFKEQLEDVLEYATISDNGGGSYDTSSKVLSWADVTLKPGEKQQRTFAVSVLATIPTVARGQSEPGSYDCQMNNVFGNNIQIKVGCPVAKTVEQTISTLPSTGPGENMAFATVLLVVVSFFWARSRQLGKEIRLVRKDFSASTI